MSKYICLKDLNYHDSEMIHQVNIKPATRTIQIISLICWQTVNDIILPRAMVTVQAEQLQIQCEHKQGTFHVELGLLVFVSYTSFKTSSQQCYSQNQSEKEGSNNMAPRVCQGKPSIDFDFDR